MSVRTEADPYENDPARWGHSLANIAELLTGCLDASGAKSVAEVGAYAGDLTGVLLDWAAGADARVVAIDPTPHDRLVELSERHRELELIRETSHDALRQLPLPDAVIIDGDHNYYTVSEDLRIIGERAPSDEIPLLMLHDVGWPHGRRDAYWTPDRIPDEHRQPMVDRAHLLPGEPGLVDAGLPMYSTAKREGGPRNGVLTALEDFLDRRGDLQLAVLPPFFGFGVVWHRDAPWAAAVAEVVGPWDRHPVLERLEANRVHHLATSHSRSSKLMRARAQLKREQEPNGKPGKLTWQSDERCVVGDTLFHILRPDLFDSPRPRMSIKGADFLLTKPRPLIERYVELIEELRPRQIFELGILQGGSTAFLFEVARPRRLVAVDRNPMEGPRAGRKLRNYIERKGFDEAVRVYGEVDQADRPRLAEIVEEAFGDEPLDLVVDDCSHLYDATRASFNELFPRLRPGGLYTIEDWAWAHTALDAEQPDGMWPDQVPLTRLVFELLLAIPSLPGLISEVTVETESVQVRRGDLRVDPSGFDISACSNPRGRRLLGDERVGTVVPPASR